MMICKKRVKRKREILNLSIVSWKNLAILQ